MSVSITLNSDGSSANFNLSANAAKVIKTLSTLNVTDVKSFAIKNKSSGATLTQWKKPLSTIFSAGEKGSLSYKQDEYRMAEGGRRTRRHRRSRRSTRRNKW